MATLVLHRGRNARRELAAPRIEAEPAREMVDCVFCGAPNGAHREGCFNCGGLLPGRQDSRELVRQVIGGDGEPERVVCARADIGGRPQTSPRAWDVICRRDVG
jgi:hypothetical protein